MRRKRKHPQHKGMSPFTAGLIAVVLIAAGTFFGFTKTNPFANPYEISAAFETANNLKPNSPVRIAGVDVGKVKTVKALEGGGAVVRMELKDKGLPIHEDATMKVRPMSLPSRSSRPIGSTSGGTSHGREARTPP